MQGEEETQWREMVAKPNHATLQEPEAQHHEQRANSHERSPEPLAVLAVQIDPQLKKDVLKLADEAGVSLDQVVSGLLHGAVNAPAQHVEEHHSLKVGFTAAGFTSLNPAGSPTFPFLKSQHCFPNLTGRLNKLTCLYISPYTLRRFDSFSSLSK